MNGLVRRPADGWPWSPAYPRQGVADQEEVGSDMGTGVTSDSGYLAWNDALAARFFCLEAAGQAVYLFRSPVGQALRRVVTISHPPARLGWGPGRPGSRCTHLWASRKLECPRSASRPAAPLTGVRQWPRLSTPPAAPRSRSRPEADQCAHLHLPPLVRRPRWTGSHAQLGLWLLGRRRLAGSRLACQRPRASGDTRAYLARLAHRGVARVGQQGGRA
jgi:hypothetical protein